MIKTSREQLFQVGWVVSCETTVSPALVVAPDATPPLAEAERGKHGAGVRRLRGAACYLQRRAVIYDGTFYVAGMILPEVRPRRKVGAPFG